MDWFVLIDVAHTAPKSHPSCRDCSR